MHRLRVRSLLVAIFFVVALALLELAVRGCSAPPCYIGFSPFESELGYVSPGGFEAPCYDAGGRFLFRLNAHGSRGRDLPTENAPAPAGVERVLFLGDSFLQAWTVRDEQTLSGAFERLQNEAGRPSESYVLSCNDYGTAQELLMLERHGMRVRPALVVLQVYAPNDLPNNTLALAGQAENSVGDYLRPYFVIGADGELARTFAQPVRAFLRHSRAFTWLDHALITSNDAALADAYSPWPLAHPSMKVRLEQGRTPLEWHEIFRPHAPGTPWEEGWLVTARLVREVAARTRELGARLLVLGIPARMQSVVDGQSLVEVDRAVHWGGAEMLQTLDMNLPERRLTALCAEAGLELRLLLEPLRDEAARTRQVLFTIDGHLTGRALVRAAEIVADWARGGDGFPLARPGAVLTRPANILPPCAESPPWLDLRGAPELPWLGYGWTRTGVPGTDESAWSFTKSAFVVLPARSGAKLVAEGTLLPGPSFPTTLAFGTPWKPKTQLVCREPGPFRIEYALPAARLEEQLLPFELWLAGPPGQPNPTVIVTGIGVH